MAFLVEGCVSAGIRLIDLCSLFDDFNSGGTSGGTGIRGVGIGICGRLI